jgi:hypothetical protein
MSISVLDLPSRAARIQADREDKNMILLMSGIKKFNDEYAGMLEKLLPGVAKDADLNSITAVFDSLKHAAEQAANYLSLNEEGRRGSMEVVRNIGK